MIGRTNTGGGGSGGGNELVIIGSPSRPKKATQNMIWVNTGEEVPGYQLSSEYQGKNLLPKLKKATDSNTTSSGLAFTFNSDGSISVNGTSAVSEDIYFATSDITLPAGSYVFSGSPVNSSFGNNDMFLKNLDTNVNFSRSYTGTTEDQFTLTEETRCRAFCRVKANATVSNLTWYPMIRRVGTDDTYEPYGGAKEGFVWMLVSDSGDIKIDATVGDNLITLYPGEVKQYTDGEWINRPAEIYQGAAWSELVILETPVLDSSYPKDVTKTVIKGNTTSATFNVVITKDGNPAEYTYQWYVDGKAVSGATGSSFTKSDLSTTATYSVCCEVTNKSGAVTSRAATLKVTQYYTPTLNSSLPADSSITVVKGNTKSATFNVSVATNGVPNSYTYQWHKDGTAVSGATSSSYTISGLGNTATHSIYCNVTNAAGTVKSRVATLKVTQQYTPTLNSAYPANASVVFNTSVTSKVEISTAGNPASYTYQWYKNGSAVSGATNSTYTFTPTAVGTTTLYCKVTNSAGTVTSRTATITATNFVLKPSERSYTTKKGTSGEISVSGDTITFGHSVYTIYAQWLLVFDDAIDAPSYNYLKATVNITTVDNADAMSCLAVTSSKPTTSYNSTTLPNVIAKTGIPHTVKTHEISVKLGSSVSQKGYVVICGQGIKGTVTNIRLE